MFHRRFTSATWILLCQSNWQKLENMKNELNNTTHLHTLRGYKSARELLEVPSTWISDLLWMDGWMCVCACFIHHLNEASPHHDAPKGATDLPAQPGPEMSISFHVVSSRSSRPRLWCCNSWAQGYAIGIATATARLPANQRLNQLPPWPPPPPPPTSSTIARTSSPWFRLHRRRLLIMLPPSHGATVATSPTPLLQGRLFMAASPSHVRFPPRRHCPMVAVVAHVMVLCREIIVSDCERIRVSASCRDALWSGFGTLSFVPSSSWSD